MDSNHRTPERTDLQSVVVGHLTTCPMVIIACRPNQLFKLDAMPGAREGSRTRDLLITNQLLYQLSYSGLILFTILPIYKELKQMYLSTCFFGKAKVSEFVKWKNFGVFFILIGSYCTFR